MNINKLIKTGLKNLNVNKMRTSLAILGIGSVIALISLGQTGKSAVQSQIQSIGSNLLTVSPGFTSSGGIRTAAGGATTLTLEDAEAVRDASSVAGIKNVSPEYSSRAQVISGRNNTNTQVVGVEPVYSVVRKLSLSSGSFITSGHLTALSRVAVLGPTVVEDLFGEGVNPVGSAIRISGKIFQVIGVAKSKGGSGFQNQDDRIYIPLTTAQKQLFGVRHLSSIALEASSEDVMTRAQNQVGYLLLDRHHLA